LMRTLRVILPLGPSSTPL